MTRTLTALATAATIAVAAVATPTTADARRGWRGPGFIGGFAAGAIIGGALAARPYYSPYYAPPAYYYAPAPTYYYAPALGPVEYEVYQQQGPVYQQPGGYDGCWIYRGGDRYYTC